MNFKLFEDNSKKQLPEDPNAPVYYKEAQGMLRKSASVKRWESIGVGKSGDGFGVYALDDIKDNELIEECPVIEAPKLEVQGTVSMDYMFKISNGLYVLALGNGSIYNHRNQPNALWEYNPEKKTLIIRATRAITCGEEIYISYGREYFKTREQNMKA